jgi:thiamine biosynthesis lipoprotein
MRPLLGTFVEIGFHPAGGDQAAVLDAFAAIEEVQRRLSFQDPDSELSSLNRCGADFVALSPLAARVLRLARAMTAASDGLFNCTLGGALVRRGVLPDHGFGEMVDAGGAADIEIRGRAARLARPVRLTLDGIAKGFAVDLAVRVLRRAGLRAGWVNAGGDLRVFGPLTLPVHRREDGGALLPLGGLRDAAIASSAVRSRTDARFPGMIVSAAGNRLAPGVWSVLARHAWRADALTKVAALAPDATRQALLRRLGGQLVSPATAMNP